MVDIKNYIFICNVKFSTFFELPFYSNNIINLLKLIL